jgi:hypothetical protein
MPLRQTSSGDPGKARPKSRAGKAFTPIPTQLHCVATHPAASGVMVPEKIVERLRPSLWTALAGAILLAAAAPASAQDSRLTGEDVALLDALAALMFNLEDGLPTLPLNDPVARELQDGRIVFRYVEPSEFYGSKEDWAQHLAASKFRRNRFDAIPARHCLVEIEHRIEYSQGDSRELFGENESGSLVTVDLGSYQRFEFAMDSAAMGSLSMKGDKVFCSHGLPGEGSCYDAYDHSVLMPGGPPVSEEFRNAFVARRLEQTKAVRETCPPRAG